MSHFQVPFDLTEEEIFNLPTGDEAAEDTGLGWDDVSEASEESRFQMLREDPDKRFEDEVLEAVQKKGSKKGECSNSRVSTPTKKKKLPSSSSASGGRRKKPKSWRAFEMDRAQMGIFFAEGEGAFTTSSSRLHHLQSLFPDSRLKHPFAPNLLQAPQPLDYCMFEPQTPSLAGEHVHDVLETKPVSPTTLPKGDCFTPTTRIDLSEEFVVDGPHELDSISSSMLIPKDTPKLIFLKLDVQELEAILAAGVCNVYIH